MDRNILFLCTGNSARSQMAEVLLEKHTDNVFKAFGAGTEPKDKIFPPVIEVMKKNLYEKRKETTWNLKYPCVKTKN